MSLLFFMIFLTCFRAYEAKRLDNKQWITKAEHQFSWLFTLAVIILAAENEWQFISFSLLAAGLNDLLLNKMRKDIKDIWHLGDTAAWDRFWKKRLTAYKIFRYTAILFGLLVHVLSYIYGYLPRYLREVEYFWFN